MKAQWHNMNLLAVAVLMAVASQGCDSGKEREEAGAAGTARVNEHLPASKGLPFEMVVIAPRQAYEGELSDSVEMLLRCSTPVLPQHEPLFRLNIIWNDANLTTWRTFRERLILDIDSRAAKPSIGVAHNPVASPQLEVKVTARSAHELATMLGLHQERLRDLFVDSELDFMADALRRKYSQSTARTLRAICGHSICVPASLRASKRAENFLWVGTNLNDKDQNFVYYAYPWDGSPFSLAASVAHRDSAMRRNIPGSRSDQWMQTATDRGGLQQTDVPRPLAFARTRIINKENVHEIHGLWEMHNGAIGGAFVSLERVDTANRTVHVTEGFIYSPHSPKRNLMRQMEAALRTWR